MEQGNENNQTPNGVNPPKIGIPLDGLTLSALQQNKVLYIIAWMAVIIFWPISLSYYLYKKSKAIQQKPVRTAAVAGVIIFALISSSTWAAAIFNDHQQPQKAAGGQIVATASPSSSQQPTEATQVIGSRTKTSGCVTTVGLPDRACTPGAIFAGVTKDQICKSGYASSVRSVSNDTKKAVYAEYGVIASTSSQYEVDHLVSLELGGSNDIANLWPEAASPTPGYHQKDVIENLLHDEVCAGMITLNAAQNMIANDWLAMYNASATKSPSPSQTAQPTATSAPTAAPTTAAGSRIVKLSTTGICHAPGDSSYDRTTNYRAFNSVQDCLNAGGRMPKN